MSFATTGSSNRRPIRRFTAYNVLVGLVTAWRLADWPTRRSPESLNATMEGVVRAPSLFSITRTSLPSMIATQELVVPRSIPMTLLIWVMLLSAAANGPKHRGLPYVDDADVWDRQAWNKGKTSNSFQ